MALVLRVKAGVLLEDNSLACPSPSEGTIRGLVRLWVEQPSPPAAPGIPMTPTSLFVVVGDDIGPVSGPPASRYGEAVKTGDVRRLGGYEQFLADRGLSIDDYINNRNFVLDLAVPQSLVDGYTG